MAYVKNTWVDREGQTRYHETIDDDGALIFTPDYEKVTEIGTPVNADNMNHIEEGIGDHENRITVLENLPDKYLNKSQITNCILEIPQKINYTLSNGTLTIKAGSKVIVPNGANKFDEITVSKDIPCSIANSDTNMLFIRGGNAYIARRLSSQTGSGATNPTTGYYGFYNTTDNIVYDIRDGVTQNLGLLSFPVLVFTSDDTGVVSVDNVFNGFGYIGSTLFCDKGIKVLIPNGKGVNGSLKNIEYTTPKVITGTLKDARSNTNFCLHNNGILALRTDLKYNENSNYNYMDAVGNIYGVPFAIGTTTTNGVITKYKSLTNAVCLADANKTVSKLGDTMTGTLTSEANNGAEIHIKGDDTNNWLTIKGTSSNYDYNNYTNIPTETLRNLRLISYDKNGVYYFYQQVSAEPNRNICAFQVKRKLTDGTEKSCQLGLRVQDTGANTVLINGKPLQAFVTETYTNGTSGYNLYSNGYCEQWGFLNITTSSHVITLLKSYNNTDYNILITSGEPSNDTGGFTGSNGIVQPKEAGSFKCSTNTAWQWLWWTTKGYIS